MDRGELLARIKSALRDAFGERLKGVILFGSEARGDARPDSDIDVLVLVDKPARTWEEIQTVTRAVYPLMLELDRIIDAKLVDIRQYEKGADPLYRTVRQEGIVA